MNDVNTYPVRYGTATVDGVRISYREVGNRGSPAVVLLHGFPTSSHLYRNMLPALADGYYVIAPDYPGYRGSDAPDPATFRYSFDRVSCLINGLLEQKLVYSYAMYAMGYGAPVGWRLARAHSERISALMIQNDDAHEEGLLEFWNPVKKYWADAREENRRDLLGWISVYPEVEAYVRERQPPTLLVWGTQGRIYAVEAAYAYPRASKNMELHLLDTWHFVLEDPVVEAFALIRDFLGRWVQIKPGPGVS